MFCNIMKENIMFANRESELTVLNRETMILIKSFCGGSRGAVFSKRVPLAAKIIFPQDFRVKSVIIV